MNRRKKGVSRKEQQRREAQRQASMLLNSQNHRGGFVIRDENSNLMFEPIRMKRKSR